MVESEMRDSATANGCWIVLEYGSVRMQDALVVLLCLLLFRSCLGVVGFDPPSPDHQPVETTTHAKRAFDWARTLKYEYFTWGFLSVARQLQTFAYYLFFGFVKIEI